MIIDTFLNALMKFENSSDFLYLPTQYNHTDDTNNSKRHTNTGNNNQTHISAGRYCNNDNDMNDN